MDYDDEDSEQLWLGIERCRLYYHPGEQLTHPDPCTLLQLAATYQQWAKLLLDAHRQYQQQQQQGNTQLQPLLLRQSEGQDSKRATRGQAGGWGKQEGVAGDLLSWVVAFLGMTADEVAAGDVRKKGLALAARAKRLLGAATLMVSAGVPRTQLPKEVLLRREQLLLLPKGTLVAAAAAGRGDGGGAVGGGKQKKLHWKTRAKLEAAGLGGRTGGKEQAGQQQQQEDGGKQKKLHWKTKLKLKGAGLGGRGGGKEQQQQEEGGAVKGESSRCLGDKAGGAGQQGKGHKARQHAPGTILATGEGKQKQQQQQDEVKAKDPVQQQDKVKKEHSMQQQEQMEGGRKDNAAVSKEVALVASEGEARPPTSAEVQTALQQYLAAAVQASAAAIEHVRALPLPLDRTSKGPCLLPAAAAGRGSGLCANDLFSGWGTAAAARGGYRGRGGAPGAGAEDKGSGVGVSTGCRRWPSATVAAQQQVEGEGLRSPENPKAYASIMPGIRRDPQGRYVTYLGAHGVSYLYIGSYDVLEDAVRAHDIAGLVVYPPKVCGEKLVRPREEYSEADFGVMAACLVTREAAVIKMELMGTLEAARAAAAAVGRYKAVKGLRVGAAGPGHSLQPVGAAGSVAAVQRRSAWLQGAAAVPAVASPVKVAASKALLSPRRAIASAAVDQGRQTAAAAEVAVVAAMKATAEAQGSGWDGGARCNREEQGLSHEQVEGHPLRVGEQQQKQQRHQRQLAGPRRKGSDCSTVGKKRPADSNAEGAVANDAEAEPARTPLLRSRRIPMAGHGKEEQSTGKQQQQQGQGQQQRHQEQQQRKKQKGGGEVQQQQLEMHSGHGLQQGMQTGGALQPQEQQQHVQAGRKGTKQQQQQQELKDEQQKQLQGNQQQQQQLPPEGHQEEKEQQQVPHAKLPSPQQRDSRQKAKRQCSTKKKPRQMSILEVLQRAGSKPPAIHAEAGRMSFAAGGAKAVAPTADQSPGVSTGRRSTRHNIAAPAEAAAAADESPLVEGRCADASMLGGAARTAPSPPAAAATATAAGSSPCEERRSTRASRLGPAGAVTSVAAASAGSPVTAAGAAASPAAVCGSPVLNRKSVGRSRLAAAAAGASSVLAAATEQSGTPAAPTAVPAAASDATEVMVTAGVVAGVIPAGELLEGASPARKSRRVAATGSSPDYKRMSLGPLGYTSGAGVLAVCKQTSPRQQQQQQMEQEVDLLEAAAAPLGQGAAVAGGGGGCKSGGEVLGCSDGKEAEQQKQEQLVVVGCGAAAAILCRAAACLNPDPASALQENLLPQPGETTGTAAGSAAAGLAKSLEGRDTALSVFSVLPGEVVWVQEKGLPCWPAIVISSEEAADYQIWPPKAVMAKPLVCVLFFGSYMRKRVPTGAVVGWEVGLGRVQGGLLLASKKPKPTEMASQYHRALVELLAYLEVGWGRESKRCCSLSRGLT